MCVTKIKSFADDNSFSEYCVKNRYPEGFVLSHATNLVETVAFTDISNNAVTGLILQTGIIHEIATKTRVIPTGAATVKYVWF